MICGRQADGIQQHDTAALRENRGAIWETRSGFTIDSAVVQQLRVLGERKEASWSNILAPAHWSAGRVPELVCGRRCGAAQFELLVTAFWLPALPHPIWRPQLSRGCERGIGEKRRERELGRTTHPRPRLAGIPTSRNGCDVYIFCCVGEAALSFSFGAVIYKRSRLSPSQSGIEGVLAGTSLGTKEKLQIVERKFSRGLRRQRGTHAAAGTRQMPMPTPWRHGSIRDRKKTRCDVLAANLECEGD